MGLEIAILTPDHAVLTTAAGAVALTTAAGEIEVLPGHVALMGELRPGNVRIRPPDGGAERRFETGAGGFEVTGDRLMVMVDAARPLKP